MLRMRAWAWGLRRTLAYSIPLGSMSSVKAGLPLASRTASTLTSGLPTTAMSGTSRDGTSRGTAWGASGAGLPVGGSAGGREPSVSESMTSGANGSVSVPRSTAAARFTASTGFT